MKCYVFITCLAASLLLLDNFGVDGQKKTSAQPRCGIRGAGRSKRQAKETAAEESTATDATPQELDGEAGGVAVGGGDGAIIGGKRANQARDWPWIAAIMPVKGSKSYCGGVLISRKHVLTAAHCFDPDEGSKTRTPAKDIQVRLGESDFRTTDDGEHQDFLVSKKTEHFDYQVYDQQYPGFMARFFPSPDDQANTDTSNDIAILTLAKEAVLAPNVQPICLPALEDKYEIGQTVEIAGWGKTEDRASNDGSRVLLEAKVRVLDFLDCRQSWGMNAPLSYLQICTSTDRGVDTCQGDSGGPVIMERNGRYQVMGVVSFGAGCAKKTPAVNIRVNKYLPWINEILRADGITV